jgi:hypothetical protein
MSGLNAKRSDLGQSAMTYDLTKFDLFDQTLLSTVGGARTQ